MRHGYKLLVFDWDGTLMDSEARIVSCLATAIADLGLPTLDHDALKNVIGLGMKEAVTTLMPQVDEAVIANFTDRYRYHFLSDHHAPETLFPGAYDMLKSLSTQDSFLGVATGKSRKGLDRSLRETGCTGLFHKTRCADESFSKPNPQMLEDIMDALGVHPNETLMIGDTEYDMQMAKNAGVQALAVTYGVHERERLLAFEPLDCLDSITDVAEWLGA